MTALRWSRVSLPLGVLALVGGAVLGQPSCGGDADCKTGMARLHVRLPASHIPPDTRVAVVQFEVGGSIVATQPIEFTPGAAEATVDTSFPGGYPKNARVLVRAYVESPLASEGDGGAGNQVVATWYKEVVFPSGCVSLDVNFFAVPGLDASVTDGGRPETARPPDAGGDAPGVGDGPPRPDGAPDGAQDGSASTDGPGLGDAPASDAAAADADGDAAVSDAPTD